MLNQNRTLQEEMTENHKHYLTIIKELEQKLDVQSRHSTIEIKRKHSYPQFNHMISCFTSSYNKGLNKINVDSRITKNYQKISGVYHSMIEHPKETKKSPIKERQRRPRYDRVKALSNSYGRCTKKVLNLSEQLDSPFS